LDVLFNVARSASTKAHAPYSKFPVGAAILAENGKIYAGANIENVAFPQGSCAETTAIGHMIMDGATQILEVAVYAEKLSLCPPCGGCRQRLAEFGNANTRIYLCDDVGVQETVSLGELLPHAFKTGMIG
jgi:cytidine deaminase